LKITHGNISVSVDFVFDSRVGFSGTADRMDLLYVAPCPKWRLNWPHSWKFQMTISLERVIGIGSTSCMILDACSRQWHQWANHIAFQLV